LIDRLTAALARSRADYTEIRVERTWKHGGDLPRPAAGIRHRQRGPGRLRARAARGGGWGVASFTSLDRLEAMVARAGELSRAVPVDPPIRLADVPRIKADALLDLDGDVRGVPIAEKKRLLEAYNGVMLGVSDRIVDTLAVYRDEVSEYWYVNSQGTRLHELRPEVTLSGTAVARRDGTIEKGLESIGLRRGWKLGAGQGGGVPRGRGAGGAAARRADGEGRHLSRDLDPSWPACSSTRRSGTSRKQTSCTRTRRRAR